MAEEKQDEGFRLSFDEDGEEEERHRQIQADIEDLRVDKLSQRVTLITILIPILIAVILGVTYLDIKRRVISTETSGSKGFESLSRDLESRFSSLSLRQAELEEAFDKESARLNEASAAMGVRIKETDAALKALTAAAVSQKALEKTAAQTLAALEKKLAPLSQQLASTQDQVTAQGRDTVARLAELEGLLSAMDPILADLRASIQSLNAELAPLSREIETLSTEKIGKEQMDLALKLDRLRIISDLQAEDKRLEQRLGEVSRQLTVVRGELVELENRLYPHKKRTIVPKPGAKPAPKPTADKPSSQDGITEQDLN
jgi:chromosome segregation ATPase